MEPAVTPRPDWIKQMYESPWKTGTLTAEATRQISL